MLRIVGAIQQAPCVRLNNTLVSFDVMSRFYLSRCKPEGRLERTVGGSDPFETP
jgi:hypothetical protein